jgi:hypothetical protein
MLVQDIPRHGRDCGHVKDDAAVLDVGKALRGYVMGPVLGNDDEMRMRNAEPVDYKAYPVRSEDLSHATADTLCDDHDVRRELIAHVGEVIDVGFGDHEALARCGRLNRHEREHIRIRVDHTRRRIACDDLTEWTAHALHAGGSAAPSLAVQLQATFERGTELAGDASV